MSASVYRAFDAAGRLLYVGCSVNVDQRLVHHAEHADWWPFHVRVERTPYPTRDEAAAAEVEAIATEHPRWNIQGRSGDHPEGRASSRWDADWLRYERDVARRIRVAERDANKARSEYRDAQMRLRSARAEAAMISAGQSDTTPLDDLDGEVTA